MSLWISCVLRPILNGDNEIIGVQKVKVMGTKRLTTDELIQKVNFRKGKNHRKQRKLARRFEREWRKRDNVKLRSE
jgi:hypothetical protein